MGLAKWIIDDTCLDSLLFYSVFRFLDVVLRLVATNVPVNRVTNIHSKIPSHIMTDNSWRLNLSTWFWTRRQSKFFITRIIRFVCFY